MSRTFHEYLSPRGGECRPLRGRVDRHFIWKKSDKNTQYNFIPTPKVLYRICFQIFFILVFVLSFYFFYKWATEYFSNQIENQYRKMSRTFHEYLSPRGGECRPLRGRVDRHFIWKNPIKIPKNIQYNFIPTPESLYRICLQIFFRTKWKWFWFCIQICCPNFLFFF